jgi:hypothetical protein
MARGSRYCFFLLQGGCTPEVSPKLHRGLCILLHKKRAALLAFIVLSWAALDALAQKVIIREIESELPLGKAAPVQIAPVYAHDEKNIIIKEIEFILISVKAKPPGRVYVLKTSKPRIVITEIATIKQNEASLPSAMSHHEKNIIIKEMVFKLVSVKAKPWGRVHVLKTSKPKIVLEEIATIKKH